MGLMAEPGTMMVAWCENGRPQRAMTIDAAQ